MRPLPPISLDHKLVEGEAPDSDYDEWFRTKVELGLEQAREPETLIPAEQVWRDLGLET